MASPVKDKSILEIRAGAHFRILFQIDSERMLKRMMRRLRLCLVFGGKTDVGAPGSSVSRASDSRRRGGSKPALNTW